MKKENINVPESGVTAFGDKIYSIKEIFNNKEVEDYLKDELLLFFEDVELKEESRNKIVEKIISSAKNYKSLREYEKEIYKFLSDQNVFDKLKKKTSGRSEKMYELISPFIIKKTVLDLGCGKGKVGALASKEGYEVTLADVYKNPHINQLDLQFVLMKQGKDFPFKDNSFDNIFILAMLHHTQNPIHTIKETARILTKGGRLHLIETVYGIGKESLPKSSTTIENKFASLSFESQRMITMFLDYFGNHITWDYTEDPDKFIPVPFNFNKPKKWEIIFKKFGFKKIISKPIGRDKASGVYHILYIFELEIKV